MLAYHRAMPDPTTISPAAELSGEVLDFLRTPGRHAVIGTVDPDGSPHQAVTWYRLDGATVVVNSLVGRRWPANLMRDGRISITVADGPDWVAIRGRVETVEDQPTAQADIAAMAHAYESPAEATISIARFRGQLRVSFRVRPDRVHTEIGA